MDDLTKALKDYFGYDSFRLSQREVINRTCQNHNSLVIMPTGGGKSICYQLPAMLLKGVSIVVSPLIALMQDQVVNLQSNGIPAAALNSACSLEEESLIKANVQNGALKLLYVSPERALSPAFLSWIQNIKISQIAIDEAHCVSVWGNDFRPEYAQLTHLIQMFPGIPVVALTATADTATQQDIVKQLNLANAEIFVSSFERSNIHIDVLPAKNRIKLITSFIKNHLNEAGIVYCLSRKNTEQVAEKLRQAGYNAQHYHAALSSEQRAQIQDAFLKDEIQIICATIAFGMGIDKPNIRWVIHHNLPKNIESYYQEIGRAGRDGQSAEALLFAGFGDMKTLNQFIEDSQADIVFKDVQTAKLNRMWEFSQTLSCRTNFILNYFGEYREQGCGHCDHCLNPPVTFNGTIIAQKALSACLRLNQQVGAKVLIDVLRGSTSRYLLEAGYQQIKTYGAGKDIDWKSWMHYIMQLIDRGYLGIDFTRSNALFLTKLAKPVLKGEVTVTLCEQQALVLDKKETVTESVSESDMPLFVALVQLRKSIGERDGSKLFSIFSDASLRDMALRKPGDLDAFTEVSGVGNFKKDKYGAEFVELICSIVPEEQRSRGVEIKKSVKSKNGVKGEDQDKPKGDFKIGKVGDTHKETLNLYKQRLSAPEIAKQRGLKEQTIVGHLFRLQFHGEALDLSPYIKQEDIDLIQATWSKHNKPEWTRAIFEKLDGEYDYEQIRYAVCLLKRNEVME